MTPRIALLLALLAGPACALDGLPDDTLSTASVLSDEEAADVVITDAVVVGDATPAAGPEERPGMAQRTTALLQARARAAAAARATTRLTVNAER